MGNNEKQFNIIIAQKGILISSVKTGDKFSLTCPVRIPFCVVII